MFGLVAYAPYALYQGTSVAPNVNQKPPYSVSVSRVLGVSRLPNDVKTIAGNVLPMIHSPMPPSVKKSPPRKIFKSVFSPPTKPQTPSKMRSATSNGNMAKTPTKSDGNAKITSFFGK